MLRSLLLLVPLALTAGCYKTNLYNFAPKAEAGIEVKRWSHSLIVGLIPLNEIDVRQACQGKGAYAVSTRQNFWQVLLAGITGSIYTPTTAKITCRQ